MGIVLSHDTYLFSGKPVGCCTLTTPSIFANSKSEQTLAFYYMQIIGVVMGQHPTKHTI